MMQLDLFNITDSFKALIGETKVCKVCSKEKDLALFPRHSHHKDRYDTRCKACIKKQTKLRNELKKEFDYLKPDVCDCCGKAHHKTLVLDHDHITHTFRGWICEDCNQGIGKLGDSVEGVENALEYLKRASNE